MNKENGNNHSGNDISGIFSVVEVDTYHDFTVVTDMIFTGKKRVRIYY